MYWPLSVLSASVSASVCLPKAFLQNCAFDCFLFSFLDFNECNANANDCHDNATCTNFHGSYLCTCDIGYTGNGKNCTNVDECALNTDNCHSNATCQDTAGSFECSCITGFSGNGTSCTNIDECTTQTHNCAVNATCKDTDGSFTCTCNPGHTGNGTACIGNILTFLFIFEGCKQLFHYVLTLVRP